MQNPGVLKIINLHYFSYTYFKFAWNDLLVRIFMRYLKVILYKHKCENAHYNSFVPIYYICEVKAWPFSNSRELQIHQNYFFYLQRYLIVHCIRFQVVFDWLIPESGGEYMVYVLSMEASRKIQHKKLALRGCNLELFCMLCIKI